MTKALVMTQIRLRQLFARGEAGQGTLEYVGMIVVAAVIVVLVAGVAKNSGLADAFTRSVQSVTGGTPSP